MRLALFPTIGLPDFLGKPGFPPWDQWRRALQSARDQQSDPDATARFLIPMLELPWPGGYRAPNRPVRPFSTARVSASGRTRFEMHPRQPCRCRSKAFASVTPEIRQTVSSGVLLPTSLVRRVPG